MPPKGYVAMAGDISVVMSKWMLLAYSGERPGILSPATNSIGLPSEIKDYSVPNINSVKVGKPGIPDEVISPPRE